MWGQREDGVVLLVGMGTVHEVNQRFLLALQFIFQKIVSAPASGHFFSVMFGGYFRKL